MISIDEINKEIEKLEQCNCTTYQVCEKLAILYTVRNNFKGPGQEMTKSTVPLPERI